MQKKSRVLIIWLNTYKTLWRDLVVYLKTHLDVTLIYAAFVTSGKIQMVFEKRKGSCLQCKRLAQVRKTISEFSCRRIWDNTNLYFNNSSSTCSTVFNYCLYYSFKIIQEFWLVKSCGWIRHICSVKHIYDIIT